LFGRVGPTGAVTLRLVIAAVILMVVVRFIRTSPSGQATVRRRSSWPDRVVVGAFGIVLAAMNLSFYEAIARVPMGAAVTIEFSGPLAVALLGSRRVADSLWALLAGSGVAFLASAAGRHLDPVGLGLAALAGTFWALYILLSKETGRRFGSLNGLAGAMAVAGVIVLPIGVVNAGAALLRPSVLILGTVVAVLASVIPYSLELAALRRVTRRAFGVMMSLDPALATAAGFVVLGQHLSVQEWVALGLVVAANVGNTLSGRQSSAPALLA
jgi:inner membrane transporter RhtA